MQEYESHDLPAYANAFQYNRIYTFLFINITLQASRIYDFICNVTINFGYKRATEKAM